MLKWVKFVNFSTSLISLKLLSIKLNDSSPVKLPIPLMSSTSLKGPILFISSISFLIAFIVNSSSL